MSNPTLIEATKLFGGAFNDLLREGLSANPQIAATAAETASVAATSVGQEQTTTKTPAAVSLTSAGVAAPTAEEILMKAADKGREKRLLKKARKMARRDGVQITSAQPQIEAPEEKGSLLSKFGMLGKLAPNFVATKVSDAYGFVMAKVGYEQTSTSPISTLEKYIPTKEDRVKLEKHGICPISKFNLKGKYQVKEEKIDLNQKDTEHLSAIRFQLDELSKTITEKKAEHENLLSSKNSLLSMFPLSRAKSLSIEIKELEYKHISKLEHFLTEKNRIESEAHNGKSDTSKNDSTQKLQNHNQAKELKYLLVLSKHLENLANKVKEMRVESKELKEQGISILQRFSLKTPDSLDEEIKGLEKEYNGKFKAFKTKKAEFQKRLLENYTQKGKEDCTFRYKASKNDLLWETIDPKYGDIGTQIFEVVDKAFENEGLSIPFMEFAGRDFVSYAKEEILEATLKDVDLKIKKQHVLEVEPGSVVYNINLVDKTIVITAVLRDTVRKAVRKHFESEDNYNNLGNRSVVIGGHIPIEISISYENRVINIDDKRPAPNMIQKAMSSLKNRITTIEQSMNEAQTGLNSRLETLQQSVSNIPNTFREKVATMSRSMTLAHIVNLGANTIGNTWDSLAGMAGSIKARVMSAVS